jgi:hypothetical protein
VRDQEGGLGRYRERQRRPSRIDAESEHARLREIEEELDQCWDLLRQRRARVAAGEDPDLAAVRSIEEVERYES